MGCGPPTPIGRRLALGAAALAGSVAAAGQAGAAPQTFNTALPVAEGEFVFREQFFYTKAGDDPSSADRNLEVLGSVSVLGYGATSDLAVFGVLPYVDKRLELTDTSDQRIAHSTRGLGDARLFGRYTVLRDDALGRTFRIAPFAGLELPTGKEDERNAFGRLPGDLQRGSGSWDPFGGVIATYQTLDYELDLQAAYTANTEGDGFAFGDEARIDASLQYRLWPGEIGPGVPGFLYGVVEMNLVHRAKNATDGVDDPDSGGTSLFIGPGIQYVTKRWVLEALVQLPVVQNLNGTALEDDFTVSAGFRINF